MVAQARPLSPAGMFHVEHPGGHELGGGSIRTRDAMAQRMETLFSGNVQGVGFRYTTVRVASGFDVSGYVRNLADGRVHLLAEGEAEELDAFLAAVEEAMGGYIRDRQTMRGFATGEFARFGVR